MTEQSSQVFLQRAQFARLVRKIAFLLFFIALVYALAAMVYSTQVIYKVKLNHAVVLEKLGGRRVAVTDVGWHGRLPFFTRLEKEVSLMNQNLYLGGSTEPMKIISKESVALWTSAVMTYRIEDLKVWAIENLNPEKLIQSDFDGIVKDTLQANEVNNLISERETIKEQIFTALKKRSINENGPTLEEKYGIRVVSFVLNETRFGDKLVEATEEKKRRQLIAEADNYAADQEADRIKKLYRAYLESITALNRALGGTGKAVDPALLRFLVQQKWATAYEKGRAGDRTFVLHSSENTPAVTLPSLDRPERDNDDRGTKEGSPDDGRRNNKQQQ